MLRVEQDVPALLYVQEYVSVYIFHLGPFSTQNTGEQSASSKRSVLTKPNHEWKVCTFLSYSYTLESVFAILNYFASIYAHSSTYTGPNCPLLDSWALGSNCPGPN